MAEGGRHGDRSRPRQDRARRRPQAEPDEQERDDEDRGGVDERSELADDELAHADRRHRLELPRGVGEING